MHLKFILAVHVPRQMLLTSILQQHKLSMLNTVYAHWTVPNNNPAIHSQGISKDKLFSEKSNYDPKLEIPEGMAGEEYGQFLKTFLQKASQLRYTLTPNSFNCLILLFLSLSTAANCNNKKRLKEKVSDFYTNWRIKCRKHKTTEHRT